MRCSRLYAYLFAIVTKVLHIVGLMLGMEEPENKQTQQQTLQDPEGAGGGKQRDPTAHCREEEPSKSEKGCTP